MEAEVEEFGYCVRNEMDWLNEHMGEIFSRKQMYVLLSSCPTHTDHDTDHNIALSRIFSKHQASFEEKRLAQLASETHWLSVNRLAIFSVHLICHYLNPRRNRLSWTR